MFYTVVLKAALTQCNFLLTTDSPVCNLNYSQDSPAESYLNPAGRFYSGPALSGGWGLTSALSTEKYNWPLTKSTPLV